MSGSVKSKSISRRLTGVSNSSWSVHASLESSPGMSPGNAARAPDTATMPPWGWPCSPGSADTAETESESHAAAESGSTMARLMSGVPNPDRGEGGVWASEGDVDCIDAVDPRRMNTVLECAAACACGFGKERGKEW